MVKQKKYLTYIAKTLFSGEKVGCGAGMYAGVPDKGYKGHPFTIKHYYKQIVNGEERYMIIEKKIEDWNKAEAFRKQINQFGGGGFFTLGYFKVADTL
jgi:hypothetical protein